MKIAFAGTPEFAAIALQSLIDAGAELALVLTQPDRPSGRGMRLQPSPVKEVALACGIPVDQPERLRTPEQQANLAACAPDLLIVAAYGLILPQAVLDLPRLGCINIHASLLPRWRGAAPIHRAIEAGDQETGITIMQMDAGLDTGAMLMKQALPILPEDTTGSLHDKLATLGGRMIVDTLRAFDLSGLVATPQAEEGVCYAHKIDKRESFLDFRQDAVALSRKLRAFNPFPGCAATIHGSTLKLWAGEAIEGTGQAKPGQIVGVGPEGITVACASGGLRLTTLQKAGGKRLPAGEFLRGFALEVGDFFAIPD
jgi:methionyl-tRNA formyltransferase